MEILATSLALVLEKIKVMYIIENMVKVGSFFGNYLVINPKQYVKEETS